LISFIAEIFLKTCFPYLGPDPLYTKLVITLVLRENLKICSNVFEVLYTASIWHKNFENPLSIKAARRGNIKISIFGHMTSSSKFGIILNFKCPTML
jgi:hypothetical protein